MGNKQGNNKLTHNILWQLWEFIGIENWLALLNEHKPNLQYIIAGHQTLKGLCVHPDHQDTDPSFYIHVERGFAKCYGGSCGYYESNPLRLIAHIIDSSYADALQFVQTKYKPGFLPRKALEELEQQRLNQELKHEIFAAAHQLMCEAVVKGEDKQYAYASQALNWLTNTRGIATDALHALPLAIMPPLGTLTARINERYQTAHKRWEREQNPAVAEPTNHATAANNYFADYVRDPVFAGGIMLPLYTTQTEISNFKLRSPDTAKKFIITKDDYSEDMGLFGLGWNRYRTFWGNKANKNYAYVVEGEFDALALMNHYVTAGKVSFPVVSAGGNGGAPYIEKCLRASGVTQLYLVGDAPHAKGDDVVQQWLGQIFDLDVKVFDSWDTYPLASDIDEAIQRGKAADVVKFFLDTDNKAFVPPWSWATTRAGKELDSIATDDFRALMEVAATHGKYINHHLETAKYVETIAKQYNLNASLLKREIVAREGTELGFVQNCVDALQEFLFVVGSRSCRTGRTLRVFDKRNHLYLDIQLSNPRAIVSELAPTIGPLHSFVSDYVGQPPFLEFPAPDTKGRVLQKLQTSLASYMDTAFINMAHGAPDLATARELKQGYHCIRTRQGIREYVVCGSDVFKLTRDGISLTYQKLEGPADAENNTIFAVDMADTSAWYPGGLSVETLDKGKAVDLKEIYEDLVNIYSIGFQFKNHEITAKLLAALVLCYPIMDAFERPVLLFITGDTHSGKSSLLSTLAGFNYKGIQLLLASQGYESYSAAGVAGYANADTRLLALDEFESGDTERGSHVSRIMEMFRGLVSGQSDRVRGRADGSSFTQTFRLPVVFSAIRGAERPQDLNRMLLIEMEKVENKVDSVRAIESLFSAEEIEDKAKKIAVGLYPHAQRLAELEKEVRDEYLVLQKKDPSLKLEWRLASSLFSILAMLKFLGVDWVSFLHDYINEHTYAIKQNAVASESRGCLNSIMRNACITQAEGPPKTISQMLVTPELRDEINSSNKGIYFDEQTKTLLFLVDQSTGLIPVHLRAKMTGAQLKVLLERHPSALTPTAIEASGVLFRVGKYLGAGINMEDIVVLDAKPWLTANFDLDTSEETKETPPSPPKTEEAEEEQESDDENPLATWDDSETA